MADYPDYTVRQILQEGTTDWEFEKFCARLYSKIEGITYLYTSQVQDAGADAESRLKRGHSYVIASIQEGSILAKAKRDLEKLRERDPKPARVRLCFSMLKTDAKRIEIVRLAKKFFPSASAEIEVSGITQLVEQVHHNVGPFDETYEHALDEVRRLSAPINRTAAPSARLGFRVLLTTVLDQDGLALRRAIIRGLVLQAIPENTTISEEEVRQSVAGSIGLNKAIEPNYLRDALTQLKTESLIEISGEGIRLRRTAVEQVVATGDTAGSKILVGYGAIKRAIEERLGEPVEAKDFKIIWKCVKSGVIDLFRQYGVEVVELITKISAADGLVQSREIPLSVREGFEQIAKHLDESSLEMSAKSKRSLVQILPMALLDSRSGSRKWLAHLCLAYVSACSLGLHPDALKRMEARLRTWDVIPDTHIVLSALADGEPDHEAIKCLLNWWKTAGGTLLGIPSVYGEAVHHANLGLEMLARWAERCKRVVHSRRWPKAPDENVFLSSAKVLYGEDLSQNQARTYLAQFAGDKTDETAKTRRIMESDFGFKDGPAVAIDTTFEALLYNDIADIRLPKEGSDLEGPRQSDGAKQNAEARCRRDASTLAYLSAYRLQIRRSHSNRVAVMLSDFTPFRSVCNKHADRFGYTSPCIDSDRLLFALSLCPGATFSMASIESVLFGGAFQQQVRRNEKLAQVVASQLASKSERGLHTPALEDSIDKSLME